MYSCPTTPDDSGPPCDADAPAATTTEPNVASKSRTAKRNLVILDTSEEPHGAHSPHAGQASRAAPAQRLMSDETFLKSPNSCSAGSLLRKPTRCLILRLHPRPLARV